MKRATLAGVLFLMIALPSAAQKDRPGAKGYSDFTITVPVDVRDLHPSIEWGFVYCETSTLDSPMLGPAPVAGAKPDPKSGVGHATDDESLGGTRIGSGRTAFPLAGQPVKPTSKKDPEVKVQQSGNGTFRGEVTVAFDADPGRNASAAKSFLCVLQFVPPSQQQAGHPAKAGRGGPAPTSGWISIQDLSEAGGASFREEFRLRGPGGKPGDPTDPKYVSGRCGEPQAQGLNPGGPYPCAWHGRLPAPPAP